MEFLMTTSFTTTLLEALNKSHVATVDDIEVNSFKSMYGGDKVAVDLADETQRMLKDTKIRIDGSGGVLLDDGTEMTFRMLTPMTVADVSLVL